MRLPPARPELADEVEAIVPTVQIFPSLTPVTTRLGTRVNVQSSGRIGCTADQYPCIGSTYQPEFRSVLVNLAQLQNVTRIELSFAEWDAIHVRIRTTRSRGSQRRPVATARDIVRAAARASRHHQCSRAGVAQVLSPLTRLISRICSERALSAAFAPS